MPPKVNVSLLNPTNQFVFWELDGDETECVLSFHIGQIKTIEVDPDGNTHLSFTPGVKAP